MTTCATFGLMLLAQPDPPADELVLRALLFAVAVDLVLPWTTGVLFAALYALFLLVMLATAGATRIRHAFRSAQRHL